MPAPVISVILPAYNASGTIGRAIESIQQQTFVDWELLVVDDGSSDGTASVAAEYCRRDQRIQLHCLGSNEGIVAALNLGIERAEASLIARMDADDASLPGRLAAQMALFVEDPGLGLVATRVQFGGDASSSGGYAAYVAWTNSVCSPEEISLQRFVESPFAHPSVMFRREKVLELGGYRAGNFPEDYELWLRWLDSGVKMAKTPEVGLIWNDPVGRLSRSHDAYSVDAFYRVKAQYLSRWLQREVPPGRRIAIWGAGKTSRQRAGWLLAEGVNWQYWVDVNPRKIGQRIAGLPVLSVDELLGFARAERPFVVSYVGSRGAGGRIRSILAESGWSEGVDFLLAA